MNFQVWRLRGVDCKFRWPYRKEGLESRKLGKLGRIRNAGIFRFGGREVSIVSFCGLECFYYAKLKVLAERFGKLRKDGTRHLITLDARRGRRIICD